MAGMLILLGIGCLLWLAFRRKTLIRQRKREAEMPWYAEPQRKMLAQMPLGIDIAVQVIASLALIALGIYGISQQ